MRTLVDPKRMRLACIVLALAGACFAFAGATWAGSPEISCTGLDLSDLAIRGCVAQAAQETEPDASTLTALAIGASAFGVSLVTGGRAIRRAMTFADAAEELGTTPGGVRQLVDQGILEIHDRRQGALYLNPEAVRQVASRKQSQDHLQAAQE